MLRCRRRRQRRCDLFYRFDTPGDDFNQWRRSRFRIWRRSGMQFRTTCKQWNTWIHRFILFHSKSDLFTVYPNPAFQHVTITGDFSSLTEIKLFDLAGKLKWHDKVLNNTGTADIDLSMIQPGMYVLSINNVIKKLVVRK